MASSLETLATALTVKQLIQPTSGRTQLQLHSIPTLHRTSRNTRSSDHSNQSFSKSRRQSLVVVTKASKNESIVEADEEDGVQLGTMKLPPNVDVARFESLLFQWANSLCQGATLPLPMPLRVDKIDGGARLAFIEIGDAKTEVRAYIDCLVYPATETSGPVFRAIRNGPSKDQPPPGEPRIMQRLQEALKKSVQIAIL